MIVALALITVLNPSTSPQPLGDDWPGWRGPTGNGVAEGASPATEWSEEKNVRWKVALPGKGSSCPVVMGDTVYVTTAVSTGKKKETSGSAESEGQGRSRFGGRRRSAPIEEQDFLVLAFSRKDGSLEWEALAGTQMPHEGTHSDGNYATPTLVADGEHVIASFGSFGVFCYDLEGEVVWSKDLGDLNIRGTFGEGSSPVLHGKHLIILWDHEGESFIVALDKATGKELWRVERPMGTNWTTPLVTEIDDKTHVIVGSIPVVGYELETGNELWSYGEAEEAAAPTQASGRGRFGGGGGSGGIIASPVISGGLLYVPHGTLGGGTLRALQMGGEGKLEEDAVVWTEARDVPRIPSPLVADGILYALKSSSGILSAFDAVTGEHLYGPERLEGVSSMYASPVLAGGKLYLPSRDGAVQVIKAGPEFESLAINRLEDRFDSSPAVVGEELYLRGLENLYCIAAAD